MHSILYNDIIPKIEVSDNSAKEVSRSQKTGIYNRFTKRLNDNSFEVIRCYVTSKSISNNNKEICPQHPTDLCTARLNSWPYIVFSLY
jgi:hypothetical protein